MKKFFYKSNNKNSRKKLNKKIINIDTKRIRPDSEIHNLVSDNSKAKKILLWKPFSGKKLKVAINKLWIGTLNMKLKEVR